MPTYEYQCASCGDTHEVVQKMSDPTLTDCPACGEPSLRKLFTNVGVVFKGSGFYRTDSREKSSSAKSTDTSSSTPSTSSTPSSGSSAGSSTSTSSAGSSSSTTSSSTTSSAASS